MARFSVIVPNHTPHAQCWEEIATSLAWALQELGHEATRRPSAASHTRALYVGVPVTQVEPDAIFYNTEQAGPAGMWRQFHLPERYQGHVVWDYSPTNASRYADWKLPTPPVVRPGFCPLLENRVPKIAEPKHDLVFFGSINPRRQALLQRLKAAGLRLLTVPFGVYGESRDSFLGHARLALNVHYYESVIFESVRCSYLALNGIPVLSETSAGGDADAYAMTGAAYEDLVEHALWLRDNPAVLGALAARQRQAVGQISMTEEVAAALDRTDHQPVTHVEIPAAPREGHAPVDFTLCMIVKDEADVIERCLLSVKPHLKRWAIVDTGSTDGTQAIIQQTLGDLPGRLIERPWKEFDGSRNDALDLAREVSGGDGWILTLDADEILTTTGPLLLPTDPRFDCYTASVAWCVGCQPFGRTTFFRASKPWYYVLPRHEGLYCRVPAPTRTEPVEDVIILTTPDGARAKVEPAVRFLQDAQVLEAWLAAHPDSEFRSRAVFYIAQSYRSAARGTRPHHRPHLEQALAHYLRRAAMGGYPAEVHAAHLAAGECLQQLDAPWEQVQQQYLLAHAVRPTRAEGLFRVGEHYRLRGAYPLALLFLRPAAALSLTTDIFADVEADVYAWKARDALAQTLLFLQQPAEALGLWLQVLRDAELPEPDRRRVEANVDHARRKLAQKPP